jgi:hypothetical protein
MEGIKLLVLLNASINGAYMFSWCVMQRPGVMLKPFK